jgi:hypothetical protein
MQYTSIFQVSDLTFVYSVYVVLLLVLALCWETREYNFNANNSVTYGR